MGLLEARVGRQSQELQAAIIAYSKGDLYGAIRYIRSMNMMLNPPAKLPPIPATYGRSMSEALKILRDHYFDISERVNAQTLTEEIIVRKKLRGPLVRVVGDHR